MSGTSVAAPHVTGLVALLLQAADQMLTANEIRDAIIQTSRHNPPAAAGWNARYGFGRVSARAALLTQTPRSPNPSHESQPLFSPAEPAQPAAPARPTPLRQWTGCWNA
jgi:subtilisin family serine protease